MLQYVVRMKWDAGIPNYLDGILLFFGAVAGIVRGPPLVNALAEGVSRGHDLLWPARNVDLQSIEPSNLLSKQREYHQTF